MVEPACYIFIAVQFSHAGDVVDSAAPSRSSSIECFLSIAQTIQQGTYSHRILIHYYYSHYLMLFVRWKRTNAVVGCPFEGVCVCLATHRCTPLAMIRLPVKAVKSRWKDLRRRKRSRRAAQTCAKLLIGNLVCSPLAWDWCILVIMRNGSLAICAHCFVWKQCSNFVQYHHQPVGGDTMARHVSICYI